MKASTLVAALILFASPARSQNCSFDTITPSQNLTWCPCEGQFLCAKLDVPLSYLDPSLGRASVPLLKLPASPTSELGPYRGMILINPGGPGGSGITLARTAGALLQSAIGSNYDIVGFDPRGVGLSSPLPDCAPSALAPRDAPRLADDFYQSYIDFSYSLGKNCSTSAAAAHMSSATTARDMLSVVAAFSSTPDGARAALDPSLLNYYGISYGTFLGQTFASMFPRRVGRVALDAVVSPEGFQANATYPNINHLDGALAAFFVYCHAAGPEKCAYHTGSTPRDIFTRWNESFAHLDAAHAESRNWDNATAIASALLTFKVAMLAAAVDPLTQFPAIANTLLQLEARVANSSSSSSSSLSAWTAAVNDEIGDPSAAGWVNADQVLGVLCSDQRNRLYGYRIDDFRPLIAQLQGQSVIGETWIKTTLGCAGWGIQSDDLFEGPYGGDTEHPVLFVSNTFDPTTPIENAVANAPKFKNARRLTIEALGHGGSATSNQCAFATVQRYFQDKLCGREHYCPLEAGPWGVLLNGTIQENLEAAGLASLRSLYD
ncbi:Tripeptidyl aminopeptidase [Colletotrichum trifolii]|uniref:Tripeptidyl aminopeptidase n=1 Tax=Colletotrichum trifolii TaxID=5466 RepID=A0A4R8RX97_COLTR|nr:Tripeptidyl aminopeptidase [Colletotrichum trifolii]